MPKGVCGLWSVRVQHVPISDTSMGFLEAFSPWSITNNQFSNSYIIIKLDISCSKQLRVGYMWFRLLCFNVVSRTEQTFIGVKAVPDQPSLYISVIKSELRLFLMSFIKNGGFFTLFKIEKRNKTDYGY